MAVSARTRKRQYENAVKREAYLNRVDRPVKETVGKRPQTAVAYRSSLIKDNGGTNPQTFKLQATERAIDFFGGLAALGLTSALASTDPIPSAPRFFVPAKLNAGVGLATPTAKRSAWGTRVVKSKSAAYSAPLSSATGAITYDTLDAKAATIRSAIQGKLGDLSYAVFYLSPEIFNNYKQ